MASAIFTAPARMTCNQTTQSSCQTDALVSNSSDQQGSSTLFGFLFCKHCEAHLDVVQPVCVLQVCKPMGVINRWEADVFEFSQTTMKDQSKFSPFNLIRHAVRYCMENLASDSLHSESWFNYQFSLSHTYSILMNSWENLCQIVGPSNFEVRKVVLWWDQTLFFLFLCKKWSDWLILIIGVNVGHFTGEEIKWIMFLLTFPSSHGCLLCLKTQALCSGNFLQLHIPLL